MTQRNIEIMDVIVDELIAGKLLSEALQAVYVKRNVGIPFRDEMFDVSIEVLGLPTGAFNSLMRNGYRTIRDVVENNNSLLKIKGFGRNYGIKFMESVLDYAWSKMDNDQRTEFLIDIVERNQGNIREELM